VETDLNERQRHWHDDSIDYFPAGPGGDDYVHQICAVQMELMNFARDVTPEPFGLQPAALVRSSVMGT